MTPPAAAITAPQIDAPARTTGARLLVRCLRELGVDVVFGYPGGAIMPVYDALPGSGIRHILTRHEQGAALAADGYARASGRVGVCMATSGPGATNLVTGLANAMLDSVPVVAITGQVSNAVMGTDAFQEVDVFGITLPVVKHSYIVRDVADVPEVIAEAFHLAAEGRPGPVLIDLPKDVTVAAIDAGVRMPTFARPRTAASPAIGEAARLVRQARRPLFYLGGGIELARAETAVRRFVEAAGFPFVATLKGLGAVPTDHPLALGMLGMHGNRAANLAVQECDLLIAVGARFDDRATGKLDEFAPGARVIHLDADAAEIGKLRRADVALGGELNTNLAALAAAVARPSGADPGSSPLAPWLERCRGWKSAHAWRYDAPGEGVYAPALLKAMAERAGDKLLLACDVGQHQMWVAQHCRIRHPRRHLTSAGLGAMGYGLPAGIGARLACPDATVVVVTGDGSIMMNIQELATLGRYGLDVRIVLLDNASLGMVRQWQELFFDANYSEIDLSDNPDFAELARVFGLEARTLETRAGVDGALEWLFSRSGPALLHVRIDPRANVWPLVPPGKNNATMIEGEPR